MVTPPFRVSFPKVFKPEYNKLKKCDQYSVVALFPPGEKLEAMKEAARKVCIERWGDNPKKWPKKLKSPFKDQGEREKEDEETGAKFMPDGYVKGSLMVTMTSKNQPGVVDKKKQEITDAEDFYAGCWARANVYIQSYDVEDGMSTGVSVSLNHLQKMKDDDPFSGRPKAEDCFEAIADDGDEVAAVPSEEEDEGANPFA